MSDIDFEGLSALEQEMMIRYVNGDTSKEVQDWAQSFLILGEAVLKLAIAKEQVEKGLDTLFEQSS